MRQGDKLRATWSKRERDVMLHFPLGSSTQSDGHWLSGILNTKFTDELERRGYDVTTLKFSIEPQQGNAKFASERQE